MGTLVFPVIQLPICKILFTQYSSLFTHFCEVCYWYVMRLMNMTDEVSTKKKKRRNLVLKCLKKMLKPPQLEQVKEVCRLLTNFPYFTFHPLDVIPAFKRLCSIGETSNLFAIVFPLINPLRCLSLVSLLTPVHKLSIEHYVKLTECETKVFMWT